MSQLEALNVALALLERAAALLDEADFIAEADWTREVATGVDAMMT
jgi:hypothetical protein